MTTKPSLSQLSDLMMEVFLEDESFVDFIRQTKAPLIPSRVAVGVDSAGNFVTADKVRIDADTVAKP